MGEIVGTDKEYYAKIGSKIAEIRESKGMTLSQLAEKIGVSESSMSRYERGGSKMDLPTIELIAYHATDYVVFSTVVGCICKLCVCYIDIPTHHYMVL